MSRYPFYLLPLLALFSGCSPIVLGVLLAEGIAGSVAPNPRFESRPDGEKCPSTQQEREAHISLCRSLLKDRGIDEPDTVVFKPLDPLASEFLYEYRFFTACSICPATRDAWEKEASSRRAFLQTHGLKNPDRVGLVPFNRQVQEGLADYRFLHRCTYPDDSGAELK